MAHPPTAETAAANVRAEIARAGYSVAKVAAEVGWSKSRMARRVSGEVPFDVAELDTLATFLKVPLTRFLDVVAA